MAVEAHHLLFHTGGGGGGQKLEGTNAGWEGGGGCYDAAAASTLPARHASYYNGTDIAVPSVGRQSHPLMQQQGYRPQNSSCVGLAAAPASLGPNMMTTMRQYGGLADASDSGVTFGGGAHHDAIVAPVRKRKRVAGDQSQVFLGLEAGVAAHLQQQLVDVDRLVLQHTAKMWAELADQRRRHARQVVAAVEAAAVKRMRAKEEEVERMGRLNWALEERVKSLLVEAQVWRDLAQSNEAAANALRAELRNALDAQQSRRAGAVADAASCCCGENDVVVGEEEVGSTAGKGSRKCVVCGEGAAEVLLLPCRHLCACAPCADKARACPACGCDKNGSVCVNFS